MRRPRPSSSSLLRYVTCGNCATSNRTQGRNASTCEQQTKHILRPYICECTFLWCFRFIFRRIFVKKSSVFVLCSVFALGLVHPRMLFSFSLLYILSSSIFLWPLITHQCAWNMVTMCAHQLQTVRYRSMDGASLVRRASIEHFTIFICLVSPFVLVNTLLVCCCIDRHQKWPARTGRGNAVISQHTEHPGMSYANTLAPAPREKMVRQTPFNDSL